MRDAARPRRLLVVAEAGVGKTAALRRWRGLHPPIALDGGGVDVPSLIAEMPAVASASDLLTEILAALRIIHARRDALEVKVGLATDRLKSIGTRVVMLDGIEGLAAVSGAVRREILEVCDRLGATGLGIVAAGRMDPFHGGLREAGFETVRLAGERFDVPFLRAMADFEEAIGLSPDRRRIADDRELAFRLYERSGSTIGGLRGLMMTLARRALTSGDNRTWRTEVEAI